MNKFVLVAIAGGLSTSTAFAADLIIPTSNQAPAYEAGFDWTGFYAGVNLGYGWSEYDIIDGATVTIDDIEGVLGGAQVGYNYDLGGFVLGAEADFQFSDISREVAIAGLGSFDVGIESFGTVRARAGVVVDRFLPYVTGGVAWANGNLNVVDGVGTTLVDEDETYVGYTIGAGLEYAVTDNLSVKGEYLYADFGSKEFAGIDTELDAHVARVGLTYKF